MRIAAFAFLLTGWGCAGGESRYSDTSRAAETSAAAQTPPTTSPPTTTTPGATTAPGQITPAMIALGDSVFHGRAAGGTCQTCHQPDAKGTTLAPNLTDNEWLNGDGSYQFMVNTITSGVPKPKKYPAAMPPMGGATLTPAQVQSVAAYEYSLSHPMH